MSLFNYPDIPFAKANQSTLNWLSGWTFGVAGIRFFDGYIARKRNLITMFGSFLDPIADKFLVVSSLVVLLYLGRVDVFVVIILVLRELYMTSLRLLAQNEGLSVPVNNIGKFKTATQMAGIPFLMTNDSLFGISLPVLGEILLFMQLFYLFFLLLFIHLVF
ncbi:MAG: CDP-alcohol phosphatidyltransferase family protein [Bacteriovoracaceae bacterium]